MNGIKNTAHPPIIVFLALLMTILVMRGPITCVGAVAEELITTLQIGYPAYGLLTALPIACFGLFCAAAPAMSKRFGLLVTVLICLALIFIGAAGRLILSYSVMLAATALIGIGIAVLNVLMPVLLRDYSPNNIALVMGVFTGLVELNPIAEFAVILVVGILLFLAGRWCWKLLVNYCKKIGKTKSDLSI